MSMPPADLKVRFRLRKDTLATMAAAIGDEAFRDTRGARLNAPNRSILIGENDSGLATRVLRGDYEPGNETVATIAARHALASGHDFWQALDEVFELVDRDGNPVSIEELRAAWLADVEAVAA